MVKMAVFDIDGTLRSDMGFIPESAKRAVSELKKKGIFVCICTGRSTGTIPDEVNALVPDGVIAGGGCYISIRGEEVKRKFFERKKIISLARFMAGHKEAGFSLETQDNIFLNTRGAQALAAANEAKWGGVGKEERKRILERGKIKYKENMAGFNPESGEVHKICYWGTKGEWGKLKNVIGPHALVQQEVWCGLDYYEVVPNGCDKGTAVTELCRKVFILPEEIIGFGDGKNDLDFFKVAGISVAMENGAWELKKMADSVCETVEQDGIYKELTKRGII